MGPGYDVKRHPVTKAQFSTIEVLVAMPVTLWELRIVPCLAGGNAPATCLKILVMQVADVQSPAPLSLFYIFGRNINDSNYYYYYYYYQSISSRFRMTTIKLFVFLFII